MTWKPKSFLKGPILEKRFYLGMTIFWKQLMMKFLWNYTHKTMLIIKKFHGNLKKATTGPLGAFH